MWRIRINCPGLIGIASVLMLMPIASGQTPNADRSSTPTELKYIPADACLAVVCSPRRDLNQADKSAQGAAIVDALKLQGLGVDLKSVERLLFVVLPPTGKDLNMGAMLRYERPIRRDDFLNSIMPGAISENMVGYACHREATGGVWLCFVDDNTVLLGTESTLRGMLERDRTDTALILMVRNSSGKSDVQAYLVVEPIRDLLAATTKDESSKPAIVLLRQVSKNLLSAEIGLPFWGPGRATLTMLARDEKAAIEVEEAVTKLVTQIRETAASSLEKIRTNPPDDSVRKILGDAAIQKAFNNASGKMRNELFSEYLPRRNQEWLTISVDVDEGAARFLTSKVSKDDPSKPMTPK